MISSGEKWTMGCHSPLVKATVQQLVGLFKLCASQRHQYTFIYNETLVKF